MRDYPDHQPLRLPDGSPNPRNRTVASVLWAIKVAIAQRKAERVAKVMVQPGPAETGSTG